MTDAGNEGTDPGGWADDEAGASTPETQAERILRAAFRYAKNGLRVLPLRPGTKVPALPDWVTRATCDPEAIATWFGPGGEYEGFNLGVATGRESDLWVLDVDLGHSDAAGLSYARLIAENDTLGDTYQVRTPSGGRHLWFRWPTEVPDVTTGELPTWRNIASSVLGDGIDVRAEGGQVAVWPSVTPVGAYAEGTGPILPVPEWLAERTKHRPKVGTAAVVRKVDLPDAAQGRAEAYALAAINRVLGDLDDMANAADPAYVPGGASGYAGRPWNDGCFKVAMRLLDFVVADWSPLSEADAYALFLEHAPKDRWFGPDQVATVWSSAVKGHSGEPASLPEDIRNPGGGNFFGTGPARNVAVNATSAVDANGAPVPIVLPLMGGPRGDRPLLENVARVIAEDTLAFGRDGRTWSYEGGVWRSDPNAIAKRTATLLHNDFHASQVATITGHLMADPNVPTLADGLHPQWINTRSGMLDWERGTLEPHSPDFRSTIQLPVEWQPDAACPRFDAWLGQVASDEIRLRIWEVIGYMVLNGNPLQRAILLYGAGGNGKGTLIRVLTALLGPWNTSAVTLRSMEKGTFEVANLYGKQANLAGDIDASHLRDTAMFKALTGQDRVQAQHKRRDPFEFLCHATPLFSANELWRSSDNSAGYHRRWVIVPMKVDVTALPRLDERDLLAELPGIFARAVGVLRDLMARGEFSDGVESMQAREDFQEASDLVRIWLKEDDAITSHEPECADAATYLKRDAIYQRFRVWAASSGVGTLSSRRFFERLRALGYREHRTQTSRGFLGFKIAASPEGFTTMPHGSWDNGGAAS